MFGYGKVDARIRYTVFSIALQSHCATTDKELFLVTEVCASQECVGDIVFFGLGALTVKSV